MRRTLARVGIESIIVLAMATLPSPANAQDLGQAATAAAIEGARQDYQAAQTRKAIASDRAGVVSQLMSRWRADIGDNERVQAGWSTRFATADVETVFRMMQALTWDDVMAASLGITRNQLGNPAAELVFNPLAPCRVMDTRFGTGAFAGPFSGGQTVSFHVVDPLNVGGAAQGGAANCGFPWGVGRGAALNITILAVGSAGDVKIYGVGFVEPNASILNFAGFNPNAVANAADVAIAFAQPFDLTIKVEFSSGVHIIVDMIGYFAASHATPLDTVRVASSATSVANNATFSINSPACPTGYAATGGGWNEINTNTGHDIQHSQPQAAVDPPTYWTVQGQNASGATQSYTVYAVCNRVPGR